MSAERRVDGVTEAGPERMIQMAWSKPLVRGAVAVVLAAHGLVSGATAAGAEHSADRVTVTGHATLDGADFDARYLGAVVERRGLVTPCQVTLPRVRAGRFRIAVHARAAAAGCGAPGARVFLWAFVGDRILFSRESVPWPDGPRTATFSPTFSASVPDGGVGPTVGFAGEVFNRFGRRVPAGARVEAFVGGTRCAVASIRRSGNFTGFSLDVVGPDSVPGCTRGGTITFRVEGQRAVETALNEPGHGTTLDLSLR